MNTVERKIKPGETMDASTKKDDFPHNPSIVCNNKSCNMCTDSDRAQVRIKENLEKMHGKNQTHLTESIINPRSEGCQELTKKTTSIREKDHALNEYVWAALEDIFNEEEDELILDGVTYSEP